MSTRAELRVRLWTHPIGTPVTVRKDDGTIVETVTRSGASVVGGTAVIWVKGIAGCYALERVTAIEPRAEVAHV